MRDTHKVNSGSRVNVNRIDLGIEYSARFGNKYFVEMAPTLGADGNYLVKH